MTDQELDTMMRRVLVDSIKLDLEAEDEEVVFKPSPQHQRQMRAMLKDPLKWASKKSRPIWKVIVQKVAMILLIISLGFGTVMVSSPTARAAFVQWFLEWYETHIVYRYTGEYTPDKMLQYGIAELPDGFVESERTQLEGIVSTTYENGTGDAIYFDYVFMTQGVADIFYTDDSVTFEVTVNHMKGQYFEAKSLGEFNTITWIDTKHDIQFNISSTLDYVGILHMAESVSLGKTTK